MDDLGKIPFPNSSFDYVNCKCILACILALWLMCVFMP